MKVSRQFYFFHEKISHTKKSIKSTKRNKRLLLRCFLFAQKAQKAQKRKQATFTQIFFMQIQRQKA